MTAKNDTMQRGLLDIMRRFRKGTYLPFMIPDGLTPSEARIIVGIYMARLEFEDTIQPRILSERMQMTPSALSQTLKLLEEKGYVVRNRVSEDYRAVSLELTEQGTAVAKEAYRLREKHLNELIEYVGADEIDHLLVTLNRIVDFHEQQSEAGTGDVCVHPCPHS
ncbi:MAG: MarR family transcriptional regulator [Raoultibacter sp.]